MEHSHTHSFTCCLQLFSYYNGRVEQQRLSGLKSKYKNIYYLGLYRKSLLTTIVNECFIADKINCRRTPHQMIRHSWKGFKDQHELNFLSDHSKHLFRLKTSVSHGESGARIQGAVGMVYLK